MYTCHMLRLNRSPEGGEGGGLPAAAAPVASEPAQPSPIPEYLSKADFESFRNEITGHLQRLTPAQREAREDAKEAKSGKPEGVKRPSLKDYDFEKDPTAVERYEDAMHEYQYQIRKAKEAEEQTAKQAEERQKKTLEGHKARVLEYKKENPSFDEDIRKAGALHGEDSVVRAVFSNQESPSIVHHIVKNKAIADELNQLALSGDEYAVHQRVGEIAAEIKAERKALEANAEAAAAKPPRQNFSKGSKGAHHEPTMEERYARFRS